MGTIKYFAYGSNMSLKRIKKRVTSAKPIGAGILRCHRLAFHKKSKKDGSGKCDIVVSSQSDVVWGRVYEIDDKQKKCLDRAEGLGCEYFEKCVTVELDCGSTVRAVTYYANPTRIDLSLKPYSWYKNYVLKGAREADLPADYVKRIEAIAEIEANEVEEDCCKERKVD